MTAVGAIGLPAIARRISRRLFASLKGERRGTEAETVGQGAAAIGRCRVCFCCLVAPARTFLPSLPYIISAASRPHHHLHRRQPPAIRTTTRNHGRRRQDSVCALTQWLQSSWTDRSRYPKHVWSPAGGWYSQPANWKANTAVMGLVMGSIVGMVWMVSANREYRDKMPEQGRFFPSR